MKSVLKKMGCVVMIAMTSVCCSQNGPAADETATQSSLDVVEQTYGKKAEIKLPSVTSFAEIQKLVGLSCESDSQCKVIGVGDSPCGGFARFLIYSNLETDENILKSKVAIFNGMQKLNNSKNGVVGICQHISPPITYCSANQCVAGINGSVPLTN